MIMEAVNRFQSKGMDVATMYFDIFARFGLVSIGFYQGASMTLLWTKLNAKHDEMSGKSSEETSKQYLSSIRKFCNLTNTMVFLGLACAISLCIYVSVDDITTDAQYHFEKNVVGYCVVVFSSILLIYLVYSYVGLRRKLH
jgi:hypothetical protein